ncbi:MAG: TIGR03936 family radical SAM-associated protein [Candidatus Merdivicinus sp.]
MDNPKIIVVEGTPVYDIRAFYRKEGRAKYISHLDLYRTIQRSFQRSRLPIWFTQGFNPHIYLTFALPIALGYEGVEESFDFRLRENLPEAEVLSRLNAALPEGIVITRIAAPQKKAEEIEKAEYTLLFSAKNIQSRDLMAKFDAYLAQDSILTQKRTKKGPKTIDLKPFIFSAQTGLSGESVSLEITLPAGIFQNINPTLLIDAFAVEAGLELEYHTIRRNIILCKDGTQFS